MKTMSTHRSASHAGSWYDAKSSILTAKLENWLESAIQEQSQSTTTTTATTGSERVRAIISPHAGYTYSGPTAAFGFRHMHPENIKRIFILGPSHHYYTPGCELTTHTYYDTPIGNLPIDAIVNQELYETGAFGQMGLIVDEEEHSIEMQLPFIAHMMKDCEHEFTLVPILVGNLDTDAEERFGEILAPYLSDPTNFFVISSDFCHWGSRFRFTPYDSKKGEIWQSIEFMDKQGMKAIETMDPSKFTCYLRETKNTICGRHPIGVLMNMMQRNNDVHHSAKFVRYAQSSRCTRSRDSSVSYAVALVQIVEGDKDNDDNDEGKK